MGTEMTIVDRIRALANGQGLNLPALESKLGLGNGTISRWSKSSPNSDKLTKVADYFNVTVDYLLGRNEQPSSMSELDRLFFSIAKDAQDNGIDPSDLKTIIDIVKRRKKET